MHRHGEAFSNPESGYSVTGSAPLVNAYVDRVQAHTWTETKFGRVARGSVRPGRTGGAASSAPSRPARTNTRGSNFQAQCCESWGARALHHIACAACQRFGEPMRGESCGMARFREYPALLPRDPHDADGARAADGPAHHRSARRATEKRWQRRRKRHCDPPPPCGRRQRR